MSISVILLAGGIGSRMGNETPKQYLPLCGKPLIRYSFEILQMTPNLCELVVVCAPDFHHVIHEDVLFATPGARRQDSLLSGLARLTKKADFIVVHDAARPLVTEKILLQVIEGAKTFGAATAAVPMKGTVKEATAFHFVKKTHPRELFFEIQTPQAIRYDLLLEGMNFVQSNGIEVTDDVSIVEILGHPVKLVEGASQNLKVTEPLDLLIAEHLLMNGAVV